MAKRRHSTKHSLSKTAKRHHKKHGKSRKTKRKMNAFMKTMLAAKKSNAPSFKYNGKTYKMHKKGHFIYYKKA